jgi:microcystin-dependent protein/glycosyltransferase involved in cell wall biosynthesis
MTSPIANSQASLALTVFQQIAGVYPSRDPGSFIGELGIFAGNFGPDGAPLASGQLLSIAQNTALFSLLGTTYGGDGRTNFALPNLNGTALVGSGQGPGLPPQDLGGQTGSSDVTLTSQQLPPDLSGTSQGFDNYQPSLPVSYIINLSGVFPSVDGGGGLDFLGEVVPFAGNFAPLGWAFADGQLLPIAGNEALFNLIGTTHGGDGETNFALPDLRDRDIIGASSGHPIGTSFGQASVSLTNAQVPTSPGGSAQPFDNEQPSLAMTYLIALQGIFPSRDGGGGVDPNIPYLGQVVAFAGNFAPKGWAVASGQLLPINQNQALFSLLGTSFGGDGRQTFALPNLNDRTVVGTSPSVPIGTVFGANIVTINSSQVPPPILSGQLTLSTIAEGAVTSAAVATFTDSNLVDTTAAFTATVDWGDGTTEAGTVTGSNGSFSVSVPGSSHFYADEGNVQPEVTITRTADNDQVAPTGTVTITEGDVLTPSGTTISVQQGQAFDGTVATFTDTNVNNVANDFVATIDWGDGTTTSGIAAFEAGQIGVGGTHTYAMSGTENVTVTLTEDASGTATATAITTADITPCYCEGTRILTDRGEVPVETLAIGDHVINADGVARPIRWVGRRSYSGRFARGTHVLPICFKAGALDVNSPRRDLRVSPHHAMFLDGVLIEALDLINGASIFQAERVERVNYFHIELDSHDIIVAEGALSESFVDDDSRGMFQNAHEFAALYPDRPTQPTRYCARRAAFGAELEAVRRQIAHRAGIPYRRPAVESGPRALVVDSRLPEVGHDGGANAVLDHVRALQAAGFEVSFLALDDRKKDDAALRSLGVTLLPHPPSGLFIDVARAHAGAFDLIYLHRVESAAHCLKPARRYFDAQVVYSVADLHHVRLKSQSIFDHDHASELMLQAGAVALQELAAALSADCVITHSESEADKLDQLPSIAAERKVHVVPWTVSVAPVQTPFLDRSGVAFVGCFAHAPNVDAVRWLVEEIMPLVWETAPNLPCLIAGSDMSEDLHQQLARPGVKVLGRVERLGEVFEQARLMIAPLRFGAGLKDKVLRAMAAGLPCVGTSEAFDGMQGLPGAITDACQRDTALGLAAAIVRMHRDEAANATCAQAGLEYIAAFYTEARVNALIRELAQPALDRFRANAISKSSLCEVLRFALGPRVVEASSTAHARGRERRIVFN